MNTAKTAPKNPPAVAPRVLWAALEITLTAAVAYLLWHLAQTLALPSVASGLGARFGDGAAALRAHQPALAARALWLRQHMPDVLAWWGAVGWLGLLVARRRRVRALSILVALQLCAALALGGLELFTGASGPFGLSPSLCWAGALGAALVALLGTLGGWLRGVAPPLRDQGSGLPHCFSAALLWPLFYAMAGR